MTTLSALNDEPTRDWQLEAGLDVIQEAGLRHVEMRAVDGKHLDDLDDATFDRVARMVRERGLTVTGYAANLGKAVLDAANWPAEQQRLESALDRARRLGTTRVRTMAYRRGDLDEARWRRETIAWLSRLERRAQDAGVTLMLENCLAADQCLGSAPRDCAWILREIDSPHLRMNLDPGNFSNWGHDPVEGFDLLGEATVNVHIKDAAIGGPRGRYVLPGDGVSQWPRLLQSLRAIGYDGCFTLEPHLRHRESMHFSGRDGYLAAATRLRQLLADAGFVVEADDRVADPRKA